MKVTLTKTPVWVKLNTTGERLWEEEAPRAPGSVGETGKGQRGNCKEAWPYCNLYYSQTAGDFQK